MFLRAGELFRIFPPREEAMNEKNEKNEKIVVGMSGGVDSSVTAALLLEQGYEVIGVTMKTYEFDDVGGNTLNETSCCGIGAVNDARMVAASLGIPHYVVDFREAFGRQVIDNFVDEYMRGRTPNPCVICNREIKWGELLRKAESLGASRIATGHYARTWFDAPGGRYVVARGKYEEKDQSYALWALSQDALAKTMFPLGGLSKPEVREIAQRMNLRTAQKDESYEICFVPDNRYDRFLQERVPGLTEKVSGGEILLNGKVVGHHQGYPFYTIGQRRGIGAYGQKMYVTGIREDDNTVTIGPGDELMHKGLTATRANWIDRISPRGEQRVTAKVRYKDDATPATAFVDSEHSFRLSFDEAKRAITPGQSVVLYNGEVVAGGGVIDAVND